MKRILAIAAAALLLGACGVDDKYYGAEIDPEKGNSAPDDTGIDWAKAADYGTAQLIDNFWRVSDNGFSGSQPNYHFTSGVKGAQDPNNNYWVQAHAVDAIIDAYLRTHDSRYKQIFDNGYKTPIGDGSHENRTGILWTSYGDKATYGTISPCFGNPFIDDMEWHALTLIRLYEATQEAIYLSEAQKLFDQIWTKGWNPSFTEVGGNGGFIWSYSSGSWTKNACSNNPGCLTAIRLYEMSQKGSYATDSNPAYLNEDYLAKAKLSYNWIRAMLFNKQTGMVYGGVEADGSINKSFTLSYDQGTFIGAAHHLYIATDDRSYHHDAVKAVAYAMGAGITSNGILRDEGAGGDNSTFKGIFVRYATEYVNDKRIDKTSRTALYDFLKTNAITLWNKGLARDESGAPTGLFTPDWSQTQEQVLYGKGGDYATPLLGWQTSGATLMEAMNVLKDPRKE